MERLSADQAVAILCPACGWRGRDDDPADGLVSAGVAACPRCSRLGLEYEFEEGVRCGGCGRLAAEMPAGDAHGSYCSRACLLQAEHARGLGS